MKKNLLTLILLAVLFVGCEEKYEFWDISKFKIDKEALKDNEEIKLLYASNGPDQNQDRSYYYHLIVVSQETGDTINVLTTIQNPFDKNSGDESFIFLSEDNIASIVTQKGFDLNKLNGNTVENLQGEKQDPINKVARDPEFDTMADNNFPTVIGTIGKNVPN